MYLPEKNSTFLSKTGFDKNSYFSFFISFWKIQDILNLDLSKVPTRLNSLSKAETKNHLQSWKSNHFSTSFLVGVRKENSNNTNIHQYILCSLQNLKLIEIGISNVLVNIGRYLLGIQCIIILLHILSQVRGLIQKLNTLYYIIVLKVSILLE